MFTRPGKINRTRRKSPSTAAPCTPPAARRAAAWPTANASRRRRLDGKLESSTWNGEIYPLVNIPKTYQKLWKITIFNGKNIPKTMENHHF